MGKPLRKGYERCALCGRVVRPAARKVPCVETASCKAAQVRVEVEGRGLVQFTSSTFGDIAEQSGVPVEWLLAGVHMRQLEAKECEEQGLDPNAVRYIEEQHKVPFAPRLAVRLIGLLNRMKMSASERRIIVRELWEDEDSIASLDALRRLNGDRTTFSKVWGLVLAKRGEPVPVEELSFEET